MAEVTQTELPEEAQTPEESQFQVDFSPPGGIVFDAPEEQESDVGMVNPMDVENPTETRVAETLGASSFDGVKMLADEREYRYRQFALESAFLSGLPKDTALEALLTIGKAPLTPRTSGEALSDLAASPAHDKKSKVDFAQRTDTVNAEQVLQESQKQLLGLDKDINLASTPNGTATEVLKSLKSHYGDEPGEDESTFMDVLDYINPLGGEEPDGMDIEVWETVKDILTLDFDADEFDKKMTSNYGEDWGKRWGWWAAKEIGIDAAILGLAMVVPPVGAALAFGKTALRARFLAAAGRSLVVGVGGGTAQVAQNVALDRDPDVVSEMVGRTVGAAGGELLGAGVKTLYKAARGKTLTEEIAIAAAEEGVKPISKTALREALDLKKTAMSQQAAYVDYKFLGDVKGYSKLMRETSDQILLKDQSEELRKSLAKFINVPESRVSEVDVDVVLPHLIDIADEVEELAAKGMAGQLNKEAVAHGASYMTMLRADNVYNKKMMDIIDLYHSESTITFRETDANIARQVDNIGTKIMKGMKIAEGTEYSAQAASNYLSLRNFNAKQQAGFTKLFEETFSGLSKEEEKTLWAILAKGDTDGLVYDFSTVAPHNIAGDISEKVIQSYHKFRLMNDLAYEIADQNMTAALKKNVRKLADGTYIHIEGKTKTGSIKYRIFDRQELKPVGPTKDSAAKGGFSEGQLSEIDTVIPYKAGHLPEGYKPHKYSVVTYDSKTGAASREAIFNSAKEAELYRAERAAANPEDIVLRITNNVETGSGGIRYDRVGGNLMDQMDEGQQEAFLAALKGVVDDPKSVGLLSTANFNPQLAKFPSSRTMLGTAVTPKAKRLRLALAKAEKGTDEYGRLLKEIKEERANNLAPSKETYLNYLSSVAHQAGENNWRSFAYDDFLRRYGPDGENVLSVGSTDPLKPVFNGTNPAVERIAQKHSEWLRRTVTQRTFFERSYDRALNAATDAIAKKAAKGVRGADFLSRALDNIPIANNALNHVRYIAALPKLLTFNVAQIAVQGSQAVGTLGYAALSRNPAQLMKDISHLVTISAIHATARKGGRLHKALQKTDAYQIYQDLIRSGYAADLNTTDILYGLKHAADPSPARKALDSVKKFGALPFRSGEAINRVTAFTTVRQQLVRDILKGKEVYGFDGKLLKASDIGSQQFREAVVDKAQVLALNMGKAGQLELTSGGGSILLQFKQVLPKEVSLFNSTALNGFEKFGVAAGLVGTFGLGAVPLAYDALRLADTIIGAVTDDPMGPVKATQYAQATNEIIGDSLEELTNGYLDSKVVQSWISKGGIAAMTDGELDIANRVALGSFLSDTFEVASPWDLVVSVAIARDVWEFADKTGFFDIVNPVSMTELMGQVYSGRDLREAILDQVDIDTIAFKMASEDTTLFSATAQILREGGKVFSQFGSLSRILDAANQEAINPDAYYANPLAPERYLTSSNRKLDVERTIWRDLQLWFGITPGKVVAEYSKEDLERRVKNGMKQYSIDMDKRIRDMAGDHNARGRLYEEAVYTLHQLQEYAEKYDLDIQSPDDGIRFVYNKLHKAFLNLTAPGE